MAANYRPAGRALSSKEFVAKLGLANEEADEAVYWLEFMAACGLTNRQSAVALLHEARELRAIIAASYGGAAQHRHIATFSYTVSMSAAKPPWLKVRAPGSENYLRLRRIMRGLKLNTVCEDAHCPNIGECWHHGTATFMILGDTCTRACAYCAVAHGKPVTLDLDEPRRVAEAVQAMGLRYAVVTSVDRDDLEDGGAGIFASTIREIRALMPGTRVEVLIPDFKGEADALETVLDAGPDVLNHNTETVPRLYRAVRSGGKYARTLELLDRARTYAPTIPTKTGLMVGLGEEQDELLQVFRDLRDVGVSILTIGQYLRPSSQHAVMTRYYHPDEFRDLKRAALDLGFVHVEAGPLVRSSYHAHEQAEAYITNVGIS
jgi:lipoic acid synthetase